MLNGELTNYIHPSHSFVTAYPKEKQMHLGQVHDRKDKRSAQPKTKSRENLQHPITESNVSSVNDNHKLDGQP